MAIIRNEERTQYLEALNTAQTKGDIQPFYTIVEAAVERTLDAYINAAEGKPVLPTLAKTPKRETLLRIGDLAKETGETVYTIRFWTKEGLLTVKDYSRGGYQLYDPSMIERAKEIRRLQSKERLTIAEIKKRLKLK